MTISLIHLVTESKQTVRIAIISASMIFRATDIHDI